MTAKALKIEIRTTAPIPAWHEDLAAILRRDGHCLRLAHGEDAEVLPKALAPLLAVQRLVHGAKSAAFAAVASQNSTQDATRLRDFETAADLVVLLAGAAPVENQLCLVPQFDGQAGEAALLAALLAVRAPALSLALAAPGKAPRIVARGLPAIEDPAVLARGLDQVIARLKGLIERSVRHIAAGTDCAADVELSAPLAGQEHTALEFLFNGLKTKIAARLRSANRRQDHWIIGWRDASAAGVADDLAWPDSGYRVLADDGQRYFADPFPVEHEGRSYIFCEEYPYATGKGRICVFERAADGTFPAPRVALECPYHLSYPQIIVRDGTIFMLPETYAARRIELYRAERFPDVWVRHAILVDDVAASDATYIAYGGTHWIFAMLAGDGGSTWDQLCLFHAPDLLGPWTAHPDNPVLIDAGAASPAGELWLREGTLWRVAQDCRTGYGGGLALCRVDTLTPQRFAQTVVARLGPPTETATGVHTLNRAAGLETIDLCGPRARR